MFNSQVLSYAIYLDVEPEVANILTSTGLVTDAQAVVVAADKSIMSYVKGILTTVLGIAGSDTEVAVYGPQLVDVDNIGHFEITLVDKTVGLVPVGDITPGTYNLIRIRAAASTTIAAAAAFSAANGRVYANITFATADWDTDDAFQIVPLADTSYDVGGVTYYPAIPTIQGYISDLSTIEGKIDTIDTVVDALAVTIGAAGAGLTAIPAPTDMALDSTVAKEATLGTMVNTGGTADLASIIGDVANVSIATQLDNIYSPHTWVGAISSTDYVDAGAEQTIIELVPGVNVFEVKCIFLDLVNITKDGAIKLYLKIDGTTYREMISSEYNVITDSDGVWIDFNAIVMDDLKVTYTEDSDEGADRAIPWQVVYRSI